MILPVIELLNESPPKVKPPTHTPAPQYTKSNASHAIAKLHFPQTLQFFRSRTKRHFQFHDWTKAHFDSRCVPRCFEPGQRIFLVSRMGICLRQTYGPSTSSIHWRDAGMTVQMNIARAIYRGSSLLRTGRGRILETRARVGDFDFQLCQHMIYCRAESKRNLGHDWHRYIAHRDSRLRYLSAGYSDAALWQCWTIFASARK